MESPKLEYRSAPAQTSTSGNLGHTAAGYAAIFNSETVIAGSFRERIAPGAFRRALKERDVAALLDHDKGRVIGRLSSGTLRLKEDRRGLSVDIDLPDSPDGVTAQALLARGDLHGMSFGFAVRAESWQDEGKLPLRILEEIDLYEVSIVTFPAYEDTSVGLRDHAASSAQAARNEMLRDVLSRDLALRIAGRGA